MRVTDQATRVVSAGWYQDPASSVQVRWWNGIAWTEHVREKPTTSPAMTGQVAISQAGLASAIHASSVTETTEERIAAVRDLEPQCVIGAVENPVVGSQASSPARVQGMAAAAATNSSAGRGSTAAAWMIALSPLL